VSATPEIRERIWELAAEVGLCEYESRAGQIRVEGRLVDSWAVRGSAAWEGHHRLVREICRLYVRRYGPW
jgi:hypothetical protein